MNSFLREGCCVACLLIVFGFFRVDAQSPIEGSGYTPVQHRALQEGEIPVTGPGFYGTPGATYVLMNDIVSARSAIFLGSSVTLDLNGYEIVYAGGGYENIPNFDFEDGLTGWDVSRAPSARIVGRNVQVFVGEYALQLKKDEEIVSPYIELPEANRSYFAMCGVAARTMFVSVYIEDEDGNVVYSHNSYGGTERQGSPVENKRPQLGGGFVFAHMFGKPAGRYRVRIKANTDAIVDYIDLRPALDVGVGIVERTYTNTHNDQLYDGWYDPAFYDYTADFSDGTPLAGVPTVPKESREAITIRNGTIRNGVNGVLSWGIQSTTSKAPVVIENVKIVTEGINTNAVEIRQGSIYRCHFDVNTPFIINRHNSGNYAVDFLGDASSEVSYSIFYGGQGCLSMKSKAARVHHNFFVNRQMVTNHYALAVGDSSLVYNNVFKPETGSGIGVGRSKWVKVFNNEIHVVSSPPTCEYGKEDYSVNGIRLSDYNAPWGDPRGCYGNEIFDNTFYVTGKDFPDFPKYIPVATAIFYSASAGDNFIYNNKVFLNALDPDSKAITSGFYVGGGTVGGVFENNTITGNTSAFWIASPYGPAKNVRLLRNTIDPGANAGEKYTAVRLGHGGALASDILFLSNRVVGMGGLTIGGTDLEHSYTVSSSVTFSAGKGGRGSAVRVLDNVGNVVLDTVIAGDGKLMAALAQYRYDAGHKNGANPYRILVDDREGTVEIDDDMEVTATDKHLIAVSTSSEVIAEVDPVTEKFVIRFPTSTKRKVVLRDAQGRTVSQATRKDVVTVPLSRIATGVHVVEIQEGTTVARGRIVKL